MGLSKNKVFNHHLFQRIRPRQRNGGTARLRNSNGSEGPPKCVWFFLYNNYNNQRESMGFFQQIVTKLDSLYNNPKSPRAWVKSAEPDASKSIRYVCGSKRLRCECAVSAQNN